MAKSHVCRLVRLLRLRLLVVAGARRLWGGGTFAMREIHIQYVCKLRRRRRRRIAVIDDDFERLSPVCVCCVALMQM